jgi:hypothetical protein
VAFSHVVFGFLIAIALTLSHASRWWRIFAVSVWWFGISGLVAAHKGICMILYKDHVRHLRPWEQSVDSEMGDERRNSYQSTENRSIQMADRAGQYDEMEKGESASLRYTFSPKNSFDSVSWISKYQKKPFLRKVFDKSRWTQDDALRVLQDKIVLGANIWAVIITIILTIVFVVLPKDNYC